MWWGNARCSPSNTVTETPPSRGTGWRQGRVLMPKLTLLLSSLGNKSVHGGDPVGKMQGNHHTNAARTRGDVAGGSICDRRQHPGRLPASPPPQRHGSSTPGCWSHGDPWVLPAAQLLPHPSLPLSTKAGSNQPPNFSWGLRQCRSPPGSPYLIRVSGILRSVS